MLVRARRARPGVSRLILHGPFVNVLILHNRYRSPGGEERSVAEVSALLREHGHAVEVLERSSSELRGLRGRARAGTAMVGGGLDPDEVVEAVRRSGADVVHAHNIHPLWGSRALAGAREAGAAVVLHLHNYRLFCAIGIGFRDGEVCTRCRGRNVLPGVRLRCRGSFPEAVAYGAGLWRQQPRIAAAVGRFVVPSAFAADRLAELGLPRESISVAHNFLRARDFAPAPPEDPPRFGLYAGRLVEEKGVETAVEAAALAGVPLHVAGTGPAAQRLHDLARSTGAPVHFVGQLDPDAMHAALAHAAFVVAPSRWDEPCPYSVIEAMAAGVPVLASDRGGLPELVGRDRVLHDRAAPAWAAAMRALWEDAAQRRARGVEALARARRLFGAERFYAALMDAYAAAGAR
jgi:glycosyltransferase involved in cell wall biosynthesis